jgi:hypothetical protein
VFQKSQKAKSYKMDIIFLLSSQKGEIIRLIKPKSVHGYDGITENLIKASAPFISPLAYICNKSIYSDIPLSFKIF